MAHGSATGRFLGMTSGLLVWAAQFTFVYGVTAIACERGYDSRRLFGLGLLPLAITTATVVALALTGFIFARSWRELRRPATQSTVSAERFLKSSTLLIAGLSIVAIAWTGLPALILPGCR